MLGVIKEGGPQWRNLGDKERKAVGILHAGGSLSDVKALCNGTPSELVKKEALVFANFCLWVGRLPEAEEAFVYAGYRADAVAQRMAQGREDRRKALIETLDMDPQLAAQAAGLHVTPPSPRAGDAPSRAA